MKKHLATKVAVLVLVSGTGLLTWTHLPGPQPGPRPDGPAACSTKEGPPPEVRPPGPSPAEIQRQLRAKALPLLDAADQESRTVIRSRLAAVDDFFTEVKRRIPGFTEAVLGFSGQWRLAADQLPLIGGSRHQVFLRNLWDQELLSEEQLQATLQSAIDGYLQGERDIEDQLLVKLQHDLAGLHPQAHVGQLDDEAVQAIKARIFNDASGHALASLKAEITRQIGAVVLGELLTQLLMRSALRGTLACSEVMSWGVGLAACLAVDQALELAWNRWLDPAGKLTEVLTIHIDGLRDLAIEGKPECPGLRPRLEELARQRGVLRREAILQSIQRRDAD
jgi:hypothetical protein